MRQVYDVNDMSNNYINRVKTNLEKMKQQNFISESSRSYVSTWKLNDKQIKMI